MRNIKWLRINTVRKYGSINYFYDLTNENNTNAHIKSKFWTKRVPDIRYIWPGIV